MLAAEGGHTKTVKTLIEAGADMDLRYNIMVNSWSGVSSAVSGTLFTLERNDCPNAGWPRWTYRDSQGID